MGTTSPQDFNALATRLITAADAKDFPTVGEILGTLDRARTDLLILINSPLGMLTISGSYVNLSAPGRGEMPTAPGIPEVARALESVYRG